MHGADVVTCGEAPSPPQGITPCSCRRDAGALHALGKALFAKLLDHEIDECARLRGQQLLARVVDARSAPHRHTSPAARAPARRSAAGAARRASVSARCPAPSRRLAHRLGVVEDEARLRAPRPPSSPVALRSVQARTRPVGGGAPHDAVEARPGPTGCLGSGRPAMYAGAATATMWMRASSRATTPGVSSMPPPIAASKPSPIRSTCRLSKCQSGSTAG